MTNPQSICIQMVANEHLFNKFETNVTLTENFDFGTALLSTYDILDEVLDYLPYNDLKSLSGIDSAWGTRINEYMKKRLYPNVFCFSQHPSQQDQHQSRCGHIKPALSIVFFNDVRIKLQYYVCIHKGTINSVSKKPVIEFLEQNLLSDNPCPVVALSSKQSEISLPSGLYFNGLVLPSIPGIEIRVMRISKDDEEATSSLINNKLGEDSTVSCLLAFCLRVRENIIFRKLQAVVKAIQERQSTRFSFGGGLVSGVKTFNVVDPKKTKRTDDLLCVMLSTPGNCSVPFQTYSLKITEHMIRNNEVEDFFLRFKVHFKKRRYSVAMRFSCMSLDDNVGETVQLFTKHFPDTPLTGFSCSGEIGWNNFNTEAEEAAEEKPPRRKKSKKNEPLVNFLTMIFVILSWGKEVQV